MKFALLVITSLVASAAAVPATVQYGSIGSYGLSSGIPAISSYKAVGVPAISTGISGIGYGYGGYGVGSYGLGAGRAIALAPAAGAIQVAAAPSVSYAAAPAISYAAAAPAISYAAPAISVAAAPAIATQAIATGPVAAAIESRRSVEVVDVPTQQEAAAPQTVVIGPNVQPINLEFQTQASPLAAQQNHLPTAPAEPQQSSYEEQPDLLRQDIVKPVVQDVYETIVPFRRITQELKPVQESLNQILPRGQERGFYQQQAIARPVAVQAAPVAVQAVQAAPVAVAAPAAVAVQAAPAAVAVQAAPAISYGASYGAGYAAPAISYGAIAQPSIAVAAKPAVGLGYAYGSGIGGLTYGGSYGSSYALKPVSGIGYTTLSGAYPIRKKK